MGVIGNRFLYRFIKKPDDILKILLLNVITKDFYLLFKSR